MVLLDTRDNHLSRSSCADPTNSNLKNVVGVLSVTANPFFGCFGIFGLRFLHENDAAAVRSERTEESM